MTSINHLAAAAVTALDCLGCGQDDRVLVLCNEPQRAIAEALAAAARPRAGAVRLMQYPTLSRSGEEPPASVAQAILEASVVLASTAYSISHTQARLAATAAGARIAGMCSLNPAIFARAMRVDYAQLGMRGARTAAALTAAVTCRITSTAGTDVFLRVEGRAGVADDGNLRHPGAFGNLPAGEAYVAPLETVGDGTIGL